MEKQNGDYVHFDAIIWEISAINTLIQIHKL